MSFDIIFSSDVQGFSPGEPWVGALTTGGPQGESGGSGYRDSENLGSAEKHREGQLFWLLSQNICLYNFHERFCMQQFYVLTSL